MSDEQVEEQLNADSEEPQEDANPTSVEDQPQEAEQPEDTGSEDPQGLTDGSLTEDSSGTEEVDWESRQKEWEDKFNTEHKARAGAYTAYMREKEQTERLNSELEQLRSKLSEAEEIRQSPVWDRRNPKYEEFISKVPLMEHALRVAQNLPEEHRGAVIADFSESDWIEFKGFRQYQQQRAARIASGDVSPLMDQIKDVVRREIAEEAQQRELQSKVQTIMADEVNRKIYSESPDRIQELVSSGHTLESAFEFMRGTTSMNATQKEIADLRAKLASAEARRGRDMESAEMPQNRTTTATSIDLDGIFDKANKLAKKRHKKPSAAQVDKIASELLEEAQRNL